MRAMILAAGHGSRMQPLTSLRAKPALPVRGRPVVSLLLAFLARHGVREVMINRHHRPDSLREAVESDHPQSLQIDWSEEPRPLGTGGGIRRAADFLRGSETCVVLAGDMLIDLDLEALATRHRTSGRAATLVLREDPRASEFGSIGLDASGRLARVGSDPRIGEERCAGLFTGIRVFSREALDHWPDRDAFEDLRDWLVPAMEDHGLPVGGEIVERAHSVWEPVGTPSEYLRANLDPPSLPSLGGAVERWSGEIQIVGHGEDVLLGRQAVLGEGARLDHAVVWEGEEVPAGLQGSFGVFAGGAFHPCRTAETGPAESKATA